ncbi:MULTISPECIES: hypothetical protein [unclassified Methylobacterium]|uniref:hypothetical protein n=1 Tax=unclassified Methylobacterium TaxID=2615210 RepID=UPI0006F56329|nr:MULTISPECIES: hypothetical protein [unclassified Methylobacterium]KQO53618.1 hypothetical protein ASF24_04575 [Methylobacterium sp. Leaf86]KQO99150.1 hypothetical protein ASF32_14950 [Methylobacterium sp. Leaf91]
MGASAIPGCLTKGGLDLVVRVDAAEFARVETAIAASFRMMKPGSIRTDDFAAFVDETRAISLGLQLTVENGRYWRSPTRSRWGARGFPWRRITPEKAAFIDAALTARARRG